MDRINTIHPLLLPYVNAVLNHEFGLLGESAKIISIESGSICAKPSSATGDRFCLRIPYCTKFLTWQILMYPNNLVQAPDFVMEDDFLADANVQQIRSQVPNLAFWKPTDQKCLLNVILELLKLYKQYQGKLLHSNPAPRYAMEYNALLTVKEVPIEDIEIYVHSIARVLLLIRLKIDFSQLPLPQIKNHTLLLIELKSNSRNTITLIKEKELDEIFENYDLPELKAEMCLIDYIPIAEKCLQDRVNTVVTRLKQRKLFFSYVVQYFEGAILNADYITFESISFLTTLHTFSYIIKVEIPKNFPDERPIITILPMRENEEETPADKEIKLYYDPKPEIELIFNYMYNSIESFFTSQHYECQ